MVPRNDEVARVSDLANNQVLLSPRIVPRDVVGVDSNDGRGAQ